MFIAYNAGMEILTAIRQSKEVEPKTHLQSGSGPFEPSYNLRDFLDIDALHAELDEVGRIKNGYTVSPNSSLKNYLTTIGLITTLKSELRSIQMQQKLIDIENLARDILVPVNPELATGPITNYEAYFANVLSLGTMLAHQSATQKLIGFAEKNNDANLANYADFSHLITATTLYIKFGDTSLDEFLNTTLSSDQVPRFYQMFFGALATKAYVNHDAVVDNNPDFALSPYRNIMRNQVEIASGILSSILGVPASSMRDFAKKEDGLIKEVSTHSEKALSHVAALRDLLEETLFDPESPGFQGLKFTLEESFETGSLVELAPAIFPFTLSSSKKLYTLYRRASKLSRTNSEHSHFYATFAEKIKLYTEEAPSIIGILSRDDAEALTDFEGGTTQFVPDINEFRKLVGNMFSRGADRAYSFKSEDINWGALVKPTEGRLSFQLNPTKFDATFTYENDSGESIKFALSFDTKKGSFDWNFLESPDDPNMQALYAAGMNAAFEILQQANELAEQKYLARHPPKKGTQPTIQPTKRILSGHHVYIPRAKAEKEAKVQPLSPIKQVLSKNVLVSEQSRVHNYISFDEEAVRDRIQFLSQADQELVITGLHRYNEHNLARFKQLKTLSSEGEVRFSLRVSSTSSRGGVRVLVREVSSETGQRFFEIIDIGNRKDIFRK